MFKKILTIISLSAIIFLAACSIKDQEPTQVKPTDTTTVTNNEDSTTRNTCGEYTQQKWFWPSAYLVRDVKKVGWFHTGTVPLEWFMSVCSWNFVATQLTFNFANLAVSDLVDSWMNQKLVGHLNSADFFDTATFPTWLFVSKLLTKNTDWYTVVGDLTIKWITNEITFPIKVTTIWNEYKINWEISIDRTKRNIMYSSTKLIDTLKDKAIEDTIKTTFELTTSPAL